jgi:hypothetical protein
VTSLGKAKSVKVLVSLAALAAGVLLISTREAHAYLDPGLGSMLLQGLIAGIAAASFFVSRYWQKLKALFSSSSREPSPADEARDPNRR